MHKQFTATAYIIQDKKVLLIFHKKLHKWLPPGGHLHPHELPHEAAIREAQEETGLEIQLFLQENLWIERWNATSIPRPYLCLLEEIPSWNHQEAHQHIDLIYIARPCGGVLTFNSSETNKIHWFTLDEILQLVPDEEIFLETQQAILHVLKQDWTNTPVIHKNMISSTNLNSL